MKILESLPPGWQSALDHIKGNVQLKQLSEFLAREYASGGNVYPPKDQVFRALQLVDFSDVRVVILGQDPYHKRHQATGLAFGVPTTLHPKPPSLVNIFKELESDLKIPIERDASDLTGWAKAGVLLLNTVMTVRENSANSHSESGWEYFTDQIIQTLSNQNRPIVFILWGSHAQKKCRLVRTPPHHILKSAHPSPLSAYRGFFNSRPFSKTNEILKQHKQKPIDWKMTGR